MALYSLDDVPQSAILRSEHWRLFERFVGSPLHTDIVAELQAYLAGEAIDSSQVGSQILKKIQGKSPQLFDAWPSDDTGGLFGMTVWNLLAKHSASWRFYPKKAGAPDDMTGTIYFRTQA